MNKNILSNILMFAAGAAVGSVVTWKLVQAKCEQRIQEEVESVREAFDKLEEITEEADEEAEPEDTDKKVVNNIIRENNYDGQNEGEEDEDDMVGPHVITYDDFAENGYEGESLYYFTDGIVTDLMYNVMDDYEDLIGDDFAEHFGEEEPDVVYIRNDKLKTDFEVLRDERRFSEVE